ncbi:MAG: hypothetical protein ACE5GS_06665 [Kiloniellaceae bacterium]
MKRIVAALAAAALLAATAPAFADGYGHGHYGHYGHYGHGHRHGHHGHGYAVLGALVGGIVLGHLLTRPSYYAAPVYYAPPAPPRPVFTHCLPTTGVGYVAGRPAEFGGTMCYDQYRRGYIVPGSTYFIRYLG